MNYDASKIGVPYPRTDTINIVYRVDATGAVTVNQTNAVTLADGTVGLLGPAPQMMFDISALDVDTLYPLVNPITGEPLGATVSARDVFMGILAIIRFNQTKVKE